MNYKKSIALFLLVPLFSLSSCGTKFDPHMTKIGEIVNLKESYDGYTFESSNSFVGRVKADGTLETYRDGKFDLTGTKKDSKPIFISCDVKEDEAKNYPNFILPGVNVANDLFDLDFTKGFETEQRARITVKYEEQNEKDFIIEISDPELATIEKGDFGAIYLKTGTKIGSSRIKIFLKNEDGTKGNQLLDYYFKVNSPIEPAEAMEYLAGTSWISMPISGEQFFINFVDNENGSFSGFSGGGEIPMFNFTYKINLEYNTQDLGEKRIRADLAGSNGMFSLKELYLGTTGNDMIVREEIGMAHIFNVVTD